MCVCVCVYVVCCWMRLTHLGEKKEQMGPVHNEDEGKVVNSHLNSREGVLGSDYSKLNENR